MEKNPDIIIEIKNLSFYYGNVEVIKDISFDIHRGHYLGIIGPNGAGKTTLLKIILGLLKPISGEIKLFGQNINDFKEWPKIGYVAQKSVNFDSNFPATVFEVVLMGRYSKRGLLKKITNEDKKIAERALEQVDLLEYKDRLIGDLSGGQQQRVFIARALAGEPEVIFLDEPTTGIDEKTKTEFYALLKKLNEQLKLTLVLISHDVEMVLQESSHIACVDRSLVCFTTPEEFIKESQSIKVLDENIKIITQHHHH